MGRKTSSTKRRPPNYPRTVHHRINTVDNGPSWTSNLVIFLPIDEYKSRFGITIITSNDKDTTGKFPRNVYVSDANKQTYHKFIGYRNLQKKKIYCCNRKKGTKCCNIIELNDKGEIKLNPRQEHEDTTGLPLKSWYSNPHLRLDKQNQTRRPDPPTDWQWRSQMLTHINNVNKAMGLPLTTMPPPPRNTMPLPIDIGITNLEPLRASTMGGNRQCTLTIEITVFGTTANENPSFNLFASGYRLKFGDREAQIISTDKHSEEGANPLVYKVVCEIPASDKTGIVSVEFTLRSDPPVSARRKFQYTPPPPNSTRINNNRPQTTNNNRLRINNNYTPPSTQQLQSPHHQQLHPHLK